MEALIFPAGVSGTGSVDPWYLFAVDNHRIEVLISYILRFNYFPSFDRLLHPSLLLLHQRMLSRVRKS